MAFQATVMEVMSTTVNVETAEAGTLASVTVEPNAV